MKASVECVEARSRACVIEQALHQQALHASGTNVLVFEARPRSKIGEVCTSRSKNQLSRMM